MSTRRLALLLVTLAALSGLAHTTAPTGASHAAFARPTNGVPFQNGDVFAAVGNGRIGHYRPDGTLVDTLDTSSGSAEQHGMCFEPSTGDLFTTDFSAGVMTRFNNIGNIKIHPWGGPFDTHPTGCVFDAVGNLYTGEADGGNRIRKWSSTGTLLGTWQPVTGSLGVVSLDVAADQCTILYTIGDSAIKRFNVCTNSQLPDLINTLPIRCFALQRLLGSSDLLVACSYEVDRVDAGGNLVQVYPKDPQQISALYAVSLDPDGQTFWTAGYSGNNIYRYRLDTGALVSQFSAAPLAGGLTGLAVYSESGATTPTPTRTASANPSTPTPSLTATLTPACGLAWRTVGSPNIGAQSNLLYGMATVAATDIWAVGFYTNIRHKTLIEHWNGLAWSVVSNPNVSIGDAQLNSIAVVTASNIWAGGRSTDDHGIQQTLIEHWDGSTWSIVPSPNAGTDGDALTGVAVVAANDVWAVGRTHTVTGGTEIAHTLIEHWNGSVWTIISSPDLGEYGSILNSVAAVATNDVWAIGTSGSSQTLTEHWDGTAWAVIPSTNPGPSYNILNSVAAQATNDVWAVGYSYIDNWGNTQALTEHWNGSSWTAIPTSNEGWRSTSLNSVVVLAADDVWAVGYASSEGYWQPLTEHWNGSNWAIVSGPPAGETFAVLSSVARDNTGRVWAVGYSSTEAGIGQTLAAHYNDPCITPSPTPTASPTVTATATQTSTPQRTPIASPTVTAIATQTGTPRPTTTRTATVLPPGTATGTATHAPATATLTASPSAIANTPTATRTAGATATACAIAFSDVRDPTTYYYQGVYYLACQGVISGYSDGTFRPFNLTTRAQMTKIVTLAFNLAGGPPPATGTFADVDPSNVFYGLIETAAAHGIVSGYTCGGVNPQTGAVEPCDSAQRPYFRPSNSVTRGQLAKIVVLGAGFPLVNPPTATFTDVASGNVFYQAIETAVCHGTISGYNDQTFRPNNSAFRGQIAKIVYLAAPNPAGTCSATASKP